MTLSQIKAILKEVETIAFQLPDGTLVPQHFHVTEVGKITKHFIDCGGTVRHEEVINFQLWNTDDYDHRLHPEKLLNIIALSENLLELQDLAIEVEYQGQTIEKYGLGYNGSQFLLTTTATDCLAKDHCGIPETKQQLNFKDIETGSSCAPGSGCC
ncbi:hypothetical protein ES677_02045 [Bizionia gelidisalsuginis]|uniref:Uncharacterized protein n=1 Tax=Bizionia gelidisalsuginis TaxID=291188 RepID=A0ABY3MDH9_9FLAO|nr:DUF6428 family protein [Bizionia gelidisalsuginis]TYC16984.1 hypothetical protein ES677_02045 [Bizionia gelidisalsuginis]